MRGTVEDSPEPRDLGSDANFAPDPCCYWETLLSLSLSFPTCTRGLGKQEVPRLWGGKEMVMTPAWSCLWRHRGQKLEGARGRQTPKICTGQHPTARGLSDGLPRGHSRTEVLSCSVSELILLKGKAAS